MFKDMVKYNIRADDLFINADGILANGGLYAKDIPLNEPMLG